MEKLKHTPAPWKASNGYILGADGYPVANITYVSRIDSVNKKLILAAPDLLAACLFAYYALTNTSADQAFAIKQLDAAIEKATK